MMPIVIFGIRLGDLIHIIYEVVVVGQVVLISFEEANSILVV